MEEVKETANELTVSDRINNANLDVVLDIHRLIAKRFPEGTEYHNIFKDKLIERHGLHGFSIFSVTK